MRLCHRALILQFVCLLNAALCVSFFLCCSGDPRDLHSFPTRRSSDLPAVDLHDEGLLGPEEVDLEPVDPHVHSRLGRSEEHTSELQSLRHLVCRLLLEKKKTIYATSTTNTARYTLSQSSCAQPSPMSS